MTPIKSKDTPKVLSPSQAKRLQSRADAYFKINPSVKALIATVDGQIFTADETGAHAAEQHAKTIRSKHLILVEKGDTLEGGDAAEKTASGKPNKEQAERMTKRAKAHFGASEDESILMTVDGNIFTNDEDGEQKAKNHARHLVNTNVFEVEKGDDVASDEDTVKAAEEVGQAVNYIEELVKEGDLGSAKAEFERLSEVQKKMVPPEIAAKVSA